MCRTMFFSHWLNYQTAIFVWFLCTSLKKLAVPDYLQKAKNSLVSLPTKIACDLNSLKTESFELFSQKKKSFKNFWFLVFFRESVRGRTRPVNISTPLNIYENSSYRTAEIISSWKTYKCKRQQPRAFYHLPALSRGCCQPSWV